MPLVGEVPVLEQPFDRLPLIVGITGHGDLREEDAGDLEWEIRSIIATLRIDYLGDAGRSDDKARSFPR